jgi:uncharacterized protein YndB with AHSA1/START domain
MMSPEVRTNPPPSRRANPAPTIVTPPTTVLLARRLAQNPERVFDAWLDPNKIPKWIVAPSPKDQVRRIVIEPLVGGTFSFVVSRDGREVEHTGTYVELDRPRRLAFTWTAVAPRESPPPRGSLVTLDFAPAGAGTELRLTHEGVAEEYALRTEEGWSKSIQALANSIGT